MSTNENPSRRREGGPTNHEREADVAMRLHRRCQSLSDEIVGLNAIIERNRQKGEAWRYLATQLRAALVGMQEAFVTNGITEEGAPAPAPAEFTLKDFREALARGMMTYGPVIPKWPWWDAMRDQQVEQHVAALRSASTTPAEASAPAQPSGTDDRVAKLVQRINNLERGQQTLMGHIHRLLQVTDRMGETLNELGALDDDATECANAATGSAREVLVQAKFEPPAAPAADAKEGA